MLSILLTTVIGLGVLSFLIFIHEAGHFVTARFFKVRVQEFGIGFPFLGRIFSFKRGETIYSINWLFFGGFVQLYGEDSGSESMGPESFAAQNVWKRIAIAGAGVVVNILFAVLVFTFLMATSNFKLDMSAPFDIKFPFGQQTEYVLITGVEKNSPASEAGLKFLDKVTKVGEQDVATVSDLQNYVKEHKGEEVYLSVKNLKEDSEREVAVTPRVNPPAGQGALGVGLDKGIELKYASLPDKVFVGFLHSANLIVLQTVGLRNFIGQSFQEGSIEPIASKASGPVGVVAALGILVQNSGDQAITTLLTLMALISLMLGIGNLLPIPAVDGGRLAFFYIEALTGKKVSAKVENLIHGVGFVILLGLIVLISINDVIRIVNGKLFG